MFYRLTYIRMSINKRAFCMLSTRTSAYCTSIIGSPSLGRQGRFTWDMGHIITLQACTVPGFQCTVHTLYGRTFVFLIEVVRVLLFTLHSKTTQSFLILYYLPSTINIIKKLYLCNVF